MASISMNPAFNDRTTYLMMNTLKHSHQLAIVKGAFVALAIIAVGVFTMAMPAMGPASDNAQSVAAESRTGAQPYQP